MYFWYAIMEKNFWVHNYIIVIIFDIASKWHCKTKCSCFWYYIKNLIYTYIIMSFLLSVWILTDQKSLNIFFLLALSFYILKKHPFITLNKFLLGVPVPKSVPIAVPHPVAVGIPQPYPVHIPVPKHIPIQVVKTVAIPVEKKVPYPVEKHIPVPVEKPVPITIEKHIPFPVVKPYPIKIPVYKTIYHHAKKH